MEKIAKKLTDLVGNTPLLELSNYNKNNDLKARLIVKIESFNPAGSVKDRIALAMIEDAETKGVLQPGHQIPSGDRQRDVASNQTTFYYTNIFISVVRFYSINNNTIFTIFFS